VSLTFDTLQHPLLSGISEKTFGETVVLLFEHIAAESIFYPNASLLLEFIE
jgi:hypothetical protein